MALLVRNREKRLAAEALANTAMPKAYDEPFGPQKGYQSQLYQYGAPDYSTSSSPVRSSKSLNPRWPFPGPGKISRSEDGPEAASSPLVYDNPAPAGYGQDGFSSERPGGDPYLTNDSPYASSSDTLDYGPGQSKETYSYQQQPRYEPAQYQRETLRQPLPDPPLLDHRLQPHRTLTPENAARSQQAEQSFVTTQSENRSPRPLKTVSNTYYHSNPPSRNSRRYHTGLEEQHSASAVRSSHPIAEEHQSYPPPSAPPRYHTPYEDERRRPPRQGSTEAGPNSRQPRTNHNPYPQASAAPSIYVHSPSDIRGRYGDTE